jgi:hypothetical protein
MPEIEIPMITELPLVEISDIGQLFHIKIGNRILISDALDYASDSELKNIIKNSNINTFHYNRTTMIDDIRRSRYYISENNSYCEHAGRIVMSLLIIASVAFNVIVLGYWLYFVH